MPAYRPSLVMARAFIAVMAASAALLPLAAHAALANHDVQKIAMHRGDAIRHDRAMGPLCIGSGQDTSVN